MRVVQLIDQLRPAGGAERLQAIFAEAVQGENVEITVLTLHDNDPGSVHELEALGARVVRFPSTRFLSPRRAWSLVRYLRAGRFDVVHTHLVRSTILGCVAARLAGIPSVASIHNTRRRRRKWGLLLEMEARVLQRVTDRVLAVGWETARVHGLRLGRPVEVIPNAVGRFEPLDAADREAIRADLDVPPGAPLVLSVGRLHPQKGFPDLLSAFSRVLEVHPDARLRIAGSGQLRGVLEREIEERGLAGRVALLGLRRDVPRLLGAADVYASAAHWEGLPVATLEAMAAGLPVVATRVGDVPRAVADGAGMLVEPGDVEGLASALIDLLDDPARRRQVGEAARAHVHAHFGRDAWAQRLLAVYRDLAGDTLGLGAAEPETRRCAS